MYMYYLEIHKDVKLVPDLRSCQIFRLAWLYYVSKRHTDS